ncbi:MAG TPA: hypothetical protein VKY33_00310 [Flavobacterium sp.]|nr:hypothetical protein [Flavobacterium sp.]
MKKIIETDLISIAHKILQIKDKSDVNSLLSETEKLYQKLILLKFYEDNKFRLEPTLTENTLFEIAETPQASEQTYFEEHAQDSFLQETDDMSEDIVNELIEDSKNEDALSFEKQIETPKPQHSTRDEEINEEETKNDVQSGEEIVFTPTVDDTLKSMEQIDAEITEIEDRVPLIDAKEAEQRVMLEIDPVFSVPHDDLFTSEIPSHQTEPITLTDLPTEEVKTSSHQHLISHGSGSTNKVPFNQIPVNKTINDAFSSAIVVGLNDRIAFEKHLFDGSPEDFNRTLSQLNTMTNYQEAKEFIDDLIKPDHNQWQGKEEYEKRFMALVEKRFL